MHNKFTDNKTRPGWDTEFSTYFWLIHLDLDHPYNNTDKITGYSKYRFQDEAQDKDYLLRRNIAMLFKRGYFERMHRVEFFQRVDPLLDKMRSPKILVCYPHHYDIPEFNHDVIYKKFGPWLHAFYECVNTGKAIDELIPAVKKGVDKDEFINPFRFDFKSVAHLYAHATRLLRHGHAQGEVEAFIRKCKELKKW